MSRLARLRPSASMAVALTALFVSLGGVSYGFASGSIDSREIKNNDVRSPDLRNNDVRTQDIRNNQVRGRDIRNSTIRGADVGLNSLGGLDIAESKLGTVPNASALGGVDASGFLRGRGGVRSGGAQAGPRATSAPVLGVAGVVNVSGDCSPTRLAIRNLGGSAHFVRGESGSANPIGSSFGTGGTDSADFAGDDGQVVWQIRDIRSGRVTTVTASAWAHAGGCSFMAQALTSTG